MWELKIDDLSLFVLCMKNFQIIEFVVRRNEAEKPELQLCSKQYWFRV